MADVIELNERRYRKPTRPTVVICVDGCDPEYVERGIADGRVFAAGRIAKERLIAGRHIIPSGGIMKKRL